MHYLSTRNDKLRETFTNILFQGLSREGGLFLPVEWPNIDINTLRDKSYKEVALHIMRPFVGGDLKDDNLYEIISSSYDDFRHPKIAPLVNVDSNKYILELFYGPTFSFKDYALQFLGNLFEHLVRTSKKQITVLGATSGDTGSAAIEAFKGKKDIKVFILHPYNKVSDIQRRQMTTVTDSNIFNIAVEGTFDDCQKTVKDLFVDQEIQKKTSLTAINSINWSRIMAQAVYYFWSYLQTEKDKISFIVPSGNFGNIFSARVAKHMGLPIDRLHISTNQNDILHRIISQGQMTMNKVEHTFSPSMDIQVASNFERQLFEIFNNNSNSIVDVMREHPTMVIKIESHTDSRGSDSYNMKLSDRRAKSTRDYIISRGIDANRIESAIGYGETQLLNKCANKVKCTEEEHQLNRRSYFYILKD
mgnify:CR=1 FL=1